MAKIAVVFAGQGAQVVGMGKALCERHSPARALFDRASRVLGFDLAQICFEGPAERLNRTDVCQPALLVHAYAASQAQSFDGHEIVAAAGLSLGEYTANLFAGALEFETAVDLVRKRGAWMQEACDATPSGMVSVLGLDQAKIESAIAGIDGVGVANVNSPGQIVISGPNEPLGRASEACKAAGAKRCIPLKVAGAYHSQVMAPAQEKMRVELHRADFSAPRFPVVVNTTARPVTNPDLLRSALGDQVCGSVLWEPCVRQMASMGATKFIEFGPGKVLSGLIKKTIETAETESFE
ncbi:MAG TPA: ACP S-malonyltransferase [Planctomycetota bacterium]|nr:ACP S-malonyltransferase [Planctomycetota bacterium]